MPASSRAWSEDTTDRQFIAAVTYFSIVSRWRRFAFAKMRSRSVRLIGMPDTGPSVCDPAVRRASASIGRPRPNLP
jgi:hypothetical protein